MRREALAAIVLAAATGSAQAAIEIIKADGSPALPEEAEVSLNPLTGGWNITLSALYAPGGWTSYEVRGWGGEVIDTLLIDVPCWQIEEDVCVPAGSPLEVRVVSADALGITSIGSIVQTGTAETLLTLVEVRGDIGHVQAEVIGEIRAGGDVIGPIVATTPDNSSRGVFWVESTGRVLGDVRAENGRIGLVYGHGGVGAPGAPVFIGAKHRINGVASDGDVYADINARMNGGTGGLFVFGAQRFAGSIETRAVIDDFLTGTPGRIRILEAFDGRITIGESFDDPQQFIELPTMGLTGVIEINADNLPNGQWAAPIHLGPEGFDRITLNGPGYSYTAESLGGGSIGLAPFDLHRSSCTPAAGTTITDDGNGNAVVLQHYGPVTLDGTAPVTVERRPLEGFGSFGPVPAASFQITPVAENPNAVRIATAAGHDGFVGGYEYRIRATDALRCDTVGQPPVQWTDDYLVSIEESDGATCDADFDDNGAVGMSDLISLLSSWGRSGPTDLDGIGGTGFTDLLMLLSAWGPC